MVLPMLVAPVPEQVAYSFIVLYIPSSVLQGLASAGTS
jgi:hypothetical protein